MHSVNSILVAHYSLPLKCFLVSCYPMQNLMYGGILLVLNNLPCWHIVYRSGKMTICIFNSVFNSNLKHTFGENKKRNLFARKTHLSCKFSSFSYSPPLLQQFTTFGISEASFISSYQTNAISHEPHHSRTIIASLHEVSKILTLLNMITSPTSSFESHREI